MPKPRPLFILTSLVLLAFLARFGLGLAAYFYLPQIGYESETQKAGYLFYDAFRRDTQAWDLAQSSAPLLDAFSGKYESDQYGGLLALSALIYRLAGAHQPLIIVFLAALVNALGGYFVFAAAKQLFNEKLALLSTFIFLFYPEAIFQGASQMREPFLMTFVAMAFYALVTIQNQYTEHTESTEERGKTIKKSVFFRVFRVIRVQNAWLWLALATAGMLLISPGILLIVLVAAAGWIYFSAGRRIPWTVMVAALAVFMLALAALTLSWDNLVAARGGGPLGVLGSWARETAKWNAYTLKRSSGIVQLMFEALPPALVMPFVSIYGILQPVLPAAIFDPAVPFWQTLGIIRAVGWYLILPLLGFAPFAAWALPENQRRRPWLWLALVVWAWVLIAAIRGGGDQWDNPRYRVILLAMQAPLIALAWEGLKSSARRWFWRILAVETIILMVFGQWYLYRYLKLGFNLGVRATVTGALGLAFLVVAGDWLWQTYHKR